jgi:uncharacterized protein (TIGR03118 family)
MRKHLVITGAVGAAALLGGVIVAGVARGDDGRGDDGRDDDQQNAYVQTILVTDLAQPPAATDTNLVNPWGVAAIPGGKLWVANNGTATSTMYTGTGKSGPLVVHLAESPTTWAPTGLTWNPTGDFMFQGDNKKKVAATFLYASEDGRLVAWNFDANSDHAIANTVVPPSSAVYKGLAFGTNRHGNFLFATNFFAGTIEVFDKDFHKCMPEGRVDCKLEGRFTDRDIPRGFAPFGIANIEDNLFVTFAKQDDAKHDDVSADGNGFVDIFATNGRLLRRLATRGVLNSPWGVVRAPFGFGKFSGALLVGNFGANGKFAGRINAFGNRGEFLGELRRPNGQAISIPGLWGMKFGAIEDGDPDALYFVAGIDDEAHGQYGEIAVASGRK